MFIKNQSQLLPNDLNKTHSYLRRIGLNALEIALKAVKPKRLIKKQLKISEGKLFIKNDIFELNNYKKIYVIGAGKASAEMAFTLEILLEDLSIDYEGVINIPEGLQIEESEKTKKIALNYSSHPIPNENGVIGTKRMIEFVKMASKNDLIICLISGGGSALLPLPKAGITLKDLQEVNSLLLASGASIHEINTIRKHLSDVKGGNLAKTLFNSSGATLISLIISDVVGNNLDSIASGPTVPDSTTFQDAIDILKNYKIYNRVPKSVVNSLEHGINNKDLENPKPNHPCFKNVYNYLIGSIESAVQEIIAYLKKDFMTSYFSGTITGEAKNFGISLYNIISKKMNQIESKKLQKKTALLGSGELTVTIKGAGIGGRNQEMLLSFLDFIKDKDWKDDFLVIGANLDGIEGNSEAMGALVDNFTVRQIKKRNISTKEYLENNDSNSFFKALKSEIITGPTGCNVNDLILILILK